MNVTLKKAASLAAKLNAIADSSASLGSIKVNIFSDRFDQELVDAAIAERDQELQKSVKRIDTVFKIRAAIGAANEGQINLLLNQRAAIEKTLALFNTFTEVKEGSIDFEATRRQMESIREGKGPSSSSSMRPASTTISIQLPWSSADLTRPLRRRKVEIDEELQRLNFVTTIELPADIVEVLRDNDII